jgi:hypothetical protein
MTPFDPDGIEGKDNRETARPETWEFGRNKSETSRTSSHREWFLVLVEKYESQQKRGEGRGDSGGFGSRKDGKLLGLL